MFEELREMIATHLNVEASSIEKTTRVVEDLGADSLDIVEFLMEIEDRFELMIPDEDVLKLKTVGDLADYVETHS